MRFLIRHWKGELSLTKSFWQNFIVAYFMLVMLLVGTAQVLRSDGETDTLQQLHFYVGDVVFSVWFIWALVGVSRSALKVLQDRNSTSIRKGFAILAVTCVVVIIVISAHDVRNLLF